MASRPETKDLSDAFIKISFQEDSNNDPLIGHWLDQGVYPSKKERASQTHLIFLGSAKHSSPLVLL
jgi:hypothetical protein